MSSSYARRLALGCAALTGILSLVSACGGSSRPSAAASTTVNVPLPSSSSSAPTLVTESPSVVATTSPAAAPAPPACPTRSLGAKVGVAQGTTDSTYTVIDFTNISQVTCTLYGYPGVALAGGLPVQEIGLAAAESHASPRQLVTLTAGAVANVLLQIVHAGNYSSSDCGPETATFLQIYPPGQTTPIYLSYSSPACSKPVPLLTVSVVQPGAGSAS